MNDLKTFNGWMAEATCLLTDKKDWTAICCGDGYMVTIGGIAYGAGAVSDEGYAYTEDDLVNPDSCAWDDELGCWAGETPEHCAAMLMDPKFVELKHG